MKKIVWSLFVLFFFYCGLAEGFASFYESFDGMGSITSNSGTLSGAQSFAQGIKNMSFNFSGSKRISYPMKNNLNITNGTIEFWVKPPAGNGYGFFDIGNLGAANSWGIYKNANYLIMEVKNSANSYDQAWSPNQFVYDDDWHFVSAVWERRNKTTYFKACLDGQCKEGYDGAISNSNPNQNGKFYIGWCGWYGYSESLIDDVSIYNHAKINEEIKADFDATRPRFEKNCTLFKPQSKGKVQINCSGLYVDGEPFLIKGVGYQPIPIGKTAQSIPDKQKMYNDVRIRERDFPLLRAMGANTIRTWSEVLNESFMDDLYNGGDSPIYVLMGFWINCKEDYSSAAVRTKYKNAFAQYVTKYKDKPSVLAWMIGNENNLGYCSSSAVIDDYNSLANELAKIAYDIEGENYHPVAIVNGDLGGIGDKFNKGDDASLNYTDFWGLNSYRGKSFGSLFADYSYLSGKPLMITEYGVDSLNNTDYQEMEYVQAEWNIAQWNEIALNTMGGTVMAYSDEWWKGAAFGGCGSVSTHDPSCGHGDFPTPDGWSNEEYFGIMRAVPNPGGADIMQPRKVYYEYAKAWGAQKEFVLKLAKGWNLVSFPVLPENKSASNILADMPVYSHNGSWFIPENIEYKRGYWVKSDTDRTITLTGLNSPDIIPAKNNWSLVGYPYLDEKSAAFFGNATVYSYNVTWKGYFPARAESPLQTLNPGMGYWVRAK